MLLNVILVFLGSIIGSIGSSSVLLYLLRRKDRVEDLVRHNDRIAEGLALQSEAMVFVLDALHEKGIVNGNSDGIRSRVNEYMRNCTFKGYSIKE